ncbi:hypothetical protein MAHJHV47_45340 [Mycobacterium avium subsp. hominissuis]
MARIIASSAACSTATHTEVTDVCKALTSVWVAVLQAALDAMIRANLPDDGPSP